jgi:hypothetical protein
MVFNVAFQQYFSYIVAVSFIGGGTRSTRRKQTTCRSQTLSHNVVHLALNMIRKLSLCQITLHNLEGLIVFYEVSFIHLYSLICHVPESESNCANCLS